MKKPLLPHNQLTSEALDELAWEHNPRLLIEWDTARNVKTIEAFGAVYWAIPADETVAS